MDEHQFAYSLITTNLYLGSDFCKGGVCLLHSEEFKTLNVAVEINLSQEENEFPVKNLETYVWLPVPDHASPSQMQFDLGSSVINDALANGKTIYVHCKNGHGRSPSLIAAYFVRFKNLEPKKALQLIEAKRPETHLEEIQIKEIEKFAQRWSK